MLSSNERVFVTVANGNIGNDIVPFSERKGNHTVSIDVSHSIVK